MMPQDMAQQGMPPQGGSGVDPQMEQALTAAEQQSAAGMAEVGASYAESMMSGLDNAEDYKTVIDSIRGNALPMEARYSELASLVGEEDARKTPESVLTLIQPTIMMTEQGAMDSGIGELMRQVTGEIDMEAENGMPTEMGQGVGSLMTAGVGQQPTQNFRLGGPVVRMATGGNPRLEQLSSEILGNYRNIMGDGEDQKKLTQAQILFDIADAAGRFASGTNAQGQSVAGLSPFAQLGAATSGLGGRIGERVGELDKQDRALKLSALGAAQTEYSAERAAARAAAKDTFSLTTLYGADGKPVTINTGNADGRARATEMVDEKGFTTVAPKEKKFEAVMFYMNNQDGTVEQKMVNVGTANGIDMAEALAERGFITDNAEASALLQERFTLKAEGRAEDRLIKAEGRAADVTLSKEERGNAEFDRRAAEAELGVIRAENRANDTTQSAEARAQARDDVERGKDLIQTIAAEKRAQAQADVDRAKDLQEKKDAEKRALETAPVKGIPIEIFNAFDPATQKSIILGDPEGVKGIPRVIFDTLSPEDQKAVLGTEDKSSFGNSLEGLQLAMLTDETMIAKFQSGKLTAAEETELVGALENYIAPKRDQFGTSISNPIPARIIQALRARQDAGLPVSQNIDPALYMPKSEADALEATRLIPLDIDITMATGPLGRIQAGLESRLSGASEIIPGLPSTSGSVIGGAEALKAKKAVSALAQATERFYTEGRILATEFANIQKELVRPDQVTNDAEALAAFEAQKSLLLQAQQRGNKILANPKSVSVEELRGARQDLAAITQLLPDYNEAIRQYSNKVNGTTTGKQNPANFDRRKGQGSGPTVIDGYTIEAIQ